MLVVYTELAALSRTGRKSHGVTPSLKLIATSLYIVRIGRFASSYKYGRFVVSLTKYLLYDCCPSIDYIVVTFDRSSECI